MERLASANAHELEVAKDSETVGVSQEVLDENHEVALAMTRKRMDTGMGVIGMAAG